MEVTTCGVFSNPRWDWKTREEEVRSYLKKVIPLKDNQNFGPWHIWPCFANNICLGYLAVYSEDKLTDRKKLMIKQLTTLLTMKWFERYNAHQKSLLRLWTDLIADPSSHYKSFSEALLKKGIVVDKGLRILVLTTQQGKSNQNEIRELLGWSAQIRCIIPRLLQIEVSNDEVVMLVNITESEEFEFRTWIQSIEQSPTKCHECSLAIGPCVFDLRKIPESYKIANNCIKISRLYQDRPIINYDDMLPELSMIDGIASMATSLFMDKFLKKFDEMHSDHSLLETAKYVSRLDDIDEVAKILHIHQNTVRYRIRRIQEITGMNLYSYNERNIFSQAIFYKEMRNLLKIN